LAIMAKIMDAAIELLPQPSFTFPQPGNGVAHLDGLHEMVRQINFAT